MKTFQSKITFKKLFWFYIASISLLLSGSLVSNNHSLWVLFILIWCNISGLFLIYKFNATVDQKAELKVNILRFFSFPSHSIVFIQFVFLVIPFAVFFLEKEVLWILSIASIFGFLYAIRLKNIFFVKNALIGLAWGSLVLIGSKDMFQTDVIYIFVFCSLQVFIGGVIRDVPDLEMDRSNNVITFPVLIGVKKTINLMHIINLSTAFLLLLFADNFNYFIVFLLPTTWRFFNLALLNSHPYNIKWSQWMNLFTCVLIFLVTLLNVFILK